MTAGDRARARRIAEGIVAAHAGYRRRVRWAIAAGAAVALVAAIPSLLLLSRPRESAGAASGERSGTALSAGTSGTPPPAAPRTYAPQVISSHGSGGATDYAAALRRWRPYGVIRVYRASTTSVQRATLRAALGSRVHFVATSTHAAVLGVAGAISVPRASSTRGSSS